MIAAAFDHAHQLGAQIGGGLGGRGTPGRGGRPLLVKAAAGAGVAGTAAGLLNREQQHVGVTVVTEAMQPLDLAARGPFVPELLA